MAERIRKMKGYVDEKLAKVQSKEWAEPLGKTMAISGKILEGFGSFVPGSAILGGAMTFGAQLLNPEPTIKDLHEELNQVKELLENPNNSDFLNKTFTKANQELQEKLEAALTKNRESLQEVLLEVTAQRKDVAQDVQAMRNRLEDNFFMLLDIKFKVSLLSLLFLHTF